MDLKIWTLEEANALIPKVDGLVTDLRRAVEEHRFALEQIHDLEAQWGAEVVRVPGQASHAEYARLVAQSTKARHRMEAALAEFQRLGVEAKDPVLGLVDFPTLRGHDVVYLCWRQGEKEITHWHALSTGFSGRKPLDDLVRAAGR